MRQAQHATEFTIRGIPFAYSKLYHSFFCDTKTLLYVLQKHYPQAYQEVTQKYPELTTVTADGKKSKCQDTLDTTFLDKVWNQVEGINEAETQTKEDDVKEDEKRSAAKPGMISRISKGIKKIVAKITPRKYRKRLVSSEEEEENVAEINPEKEENVEVFETEPDKNNT